MQSNRPVWVTTSYFNTCLTLPPIPLVRQGATQPCYLASNLMGEGHSLVLKSPRCEESCYMSMYVGLS